HLQGSWPLRTRSWRRACPPMGQAGAMAKLPTTFVRIHGHEVAYKAAGDGPALVLVHGIAGSSATWSRVMPELAETHTVIAPDLLGHGESAKPRGDYSLGAHASGIRDLLVGLDIQSASVVGHSLGGDVHFLLRAATWPGAEFVLPLIAHPRVVRLAAVVPRALGIAGVQTRPD